MIEIRNAALSDAQRLVEIYDYYVRHTAVTFEYESPGVKAFRERMARTMQRYPYLVVLRDGGIQGYAYAGPFKNRAAYDWSCETTIYLDRGAQKCGMGRMLYEALIAQLARMGILNVYACIASPEAEDQYLTANSAQFHAHLGFATAGNYSKCGYKFGRWYGMVWMEKLIGAHRADQPPVIPWPELRDPGADAEEERSI